MRGRFGFLSGALVATVFAASTPAWADGDAEGAKKHFEAGRKLRDEGDCTKAIAEFDKSLAADKSIGAYYNLGFCEEQLGHRQEAHDAYRRGRELASAKKDDRLKEISGALAALMETPNVRLVLPQPIPEGLQIKVDGDVVPPTFYQTETVVFTKAAPVHEVVVTAPGFDELDLKVQSRELKSVDLKPAGTSTPKPPKDATAPPTPPPPPETHWSTQHWIGGGLVVVGAGFLTLGTTMAVSYAVDLHANNEAVRLAENECKPPGHDGCVRSNNAAFVKAATTSNNRVAKGDRDIPFMAIFGVLGVVSVAGGIVLFVKAKEVVVEPVKTAADAKKKPFLRDVSAAPVVSPTMQGFALTGSF